MRKYRRRRGVYIHPVPVVLALLAGAAAAILCLRLLGGGGGTSPEEPPELPGDTPPPVREELPEHRTTPSGIACTRTDLGEEAIHTGELILVNNQIFYRFPEEEPPLASVYEEKNDSYYVRDMEVYLSPAAMGPLNEMLEDFVEQGGSRTINVVAGYRTEAYQQHLFDQSAQRSGQDHA